MYEALLLAITAVSLRIYYQYKDAAAICPRHAVAEGYPPGVDAATSRQYRSTSQSTTRCALPSPCAAALGPPFREHTGMVLLYMRKLERRVRLEARPGTEEEEAYAQGKEDQEQPGEQLGHARGQCRGWSEQAEFCSEECVKGEMQHLRLRFQIYRIKERDRGQFPLGQVCREEDAVQQRSDRFAGLNGCPGLDRFISHPSGNP